jgi:hypothetical protein
MPHREHRIRRQVTSLVALVTAVGASLGAGSVALAQPAQPAQPAVAVKEEAPGLLARATVTPDSARARALARVPRGRIAAAEIEEEDGKLVYSFDIKVPGRSGIEEVLVDARTGAVVSQEHEDAAQEAAERASEARAGQGKVRPPVDRPAAPHERGS